jgi:acyl dehydratase
MSWHEANQIRKVIVVAGRSRARSGFREQLSDDTRHEIVTFAATFDPQPFHVDEEAAKASLFKGLAASGIHTSQYPYGCFSKAPSRWQAA